MRATLTFAITLLLTTGCADYQLDGAPRANGDTGDWDD